MMTRALPRYRTTTSDVIRVVCELFAVPRERLLGQSQERRLTAARRVAVYICREDLMLSFPQIGRAFNRDHTSIMHALRRFVPALHASEIEAVRHALRHPNDRLEPLPPTLEERVARLRRITGELIEALDDLTRPLH